MEKSRSYTILTYFFTILSFLSTAFVAILGVFSSFNVGGVFKSPVVNISDKYFTEVTPSPFVFATIWPIIFIWTIAGSLYLVISLCCSSDKSPVKTNPAVTPLAFLILNTLAFGTCDAWYFAFDSETLGWSFALLALCDVFNYIAIGISLKRVHDNVEMLEENSKATLWLVRILVQNGLCVFATWITTASLLALSVVLIYVDSPNEMVAQTTGLVDVETGSSITLGILLAVTLVWFVLENFIWEKYLRYMFTIYPVLILAFSGLVVKVQELGAVQNLVFSSVDLSICSLLFVARIALSVYRFKSRNLSRETVISSNTKDIYAIEKL